MHKKPVAEPGPSGHRYFGKYRVRTVLSTYDQVEQMVELPEWGWLATVEHPLVIEANL
jgi:hypothetical protein